MAKARHGKSRSWQWLWMTLALVLVILGVPYVIGAGEILTTSDPAPPSAETRPQCTATICVNLVQKKMWAQDPNGIALYGPVSVAAGGAGDTATPVGLFRIVEKRNDNRLAPYSVVFTDAGYSFHQGNVSGSTQGSINLDLASAKWLYDTVQVGDAVQIF